MVSLDSPVEKKKSVTLADINCLKEYAQPLLLLIQEHFLITLLWNDWNCVLYYPAPYDDSSYIY